MCVCVCCVCVYVCVWVCEGVAKCVRGGMANLESPVVLTPRVSLDLAGQHQLGSGRSHGLGCSDQLLVLRITSHHKVGCFTQVACGRGNPLSLKEKSSLTHRVALTEREREREREGGGGGRFTHSGNKSLRPLAVL